MSVKVHEARPRDLDALAQIGEVGRGDDGLGDLTRRPLQGFREAHREIGLKICALGAAHRCTGSRVLGAEGFADRRLQTRAERRARIVRGRHRSRRAGRGWVWIKAGTGVPEIRGRVV